MRQTKRLERAPDSPPPRSDRAPSPLVFLVFCLQPEGFHLLEGGVFGLPTLGLKARLDGLEKADEFGVGSAKRVYRVELEMAGEVGHREEEIAEFLRTLGALS